VSFLIDKLNFLGLNEREIKVFTTLSTFGRMKMTKIASRSGLPRTTVDAVIRRLITQGLVFQETIGKHFEYSVGAEAIADTLNLIEKGFRPRMTNFVESRNNDENNVNVLLTTGDSDCIKSSFDERRGDRTRVLLARTREGLQNAVDRFLEYVTHAAHTGTVLEILTCSHVADEIQRVGVRDVSWTDPNLIRISIVPGAYCQTIADTVVFPDRIILRNIEGDGLTLIHEPHIVEILKHLVEIACESGWSVNLSTLLNGPGK
jgi:predicted transcriptional regulator